MRPTLGNLQAVAAAIGERKGFRITVADIQEFFPELPEQTLLEAVIWALRREIVIQNQREIFGTDQNPDEPEPGQLLTLMEGGRPDGQA